MMNVCHFLCILLFFVTYIAGIVLAKGFLSTAAAIVFAPWGWYLVVERAMAVLGWLSVQGVPHA